MLLLSPLILILLPVATGYAVGAIQFVEFECFDDCLVSVYKYKYIILVGISVWGV